MKTKGRQRKDITGQVFDRLTVLKFSHTAKNGVSYWVCKCECGNIITVNGGNLQQKKVKSCGCLAKEIQKKKTKKNKGGIYPIQAGELKGDYQSYTHRGVKTYKLSPKELEQYLEEMKYKEVKYRGDE